MTEHEIYITSSEEENEIQFKFTEKTGGKADKQKSDQTNGNRSGAGGKLSMEDKKRYASQKRSNSTGAARPADKGLPTKNGRATTQDRPTSGVENLNNDYFQTHNSPNRCPDAFFRLNPKKNLTLITRSEPDTGLKVLNHKQVSVTQKKLEKYRSLLFRIIYDIHWLVVFVEMAITHGSVIMDEDDSKHGTVKNRLGTMMGIGGGGGKLGVKRVSIRETGEVDLKKKKPNLTSITEIPS